MSKFAKVAIPVSLVFVAYIFYIFQPTTEVGDFEKVRAGGEINQNINVYVEAERGFQRNAANQVVTFFARDKHGSVARVSPKEPVAAEVAGAEVVELFGHMHGDNFIALRVEVVESAN